MKLKFSLTELLASDVQEDYPCTTRMTELLTIMVSIYKEKPCGIYFCTFRANKCEMQLHDHKFPCITVGFMGMALFEEMATFYF